MTLVDKINELLLQEGNDSTRIIIRCNYPKHRESICKAVSKVQGLDWRTLHLSWQKMVEAYPKSNICLRLNEIQPINQLRRYERFGSDNFYSQYKSLIIEGHKLCEDYPVIFEEENFNVQSLYDEKRELI